MPVWLSCPCCECYWCSRHGMHAHDCPCPPVEDWDTDPYHEPEPSVPDPPALAARLRALLDDRGLT